ncbi:MAG: hypothetical protein U0936_12405 [Planctomycetaceae bacterium]
MDRQLKGPYLLWEHLHTFEQVPEEPWLGMKFAIEFPEDGW